MACILDSELSIWVDGPSDTARIAVRCGLDFTDAEVHRMNWLGMSYTLQCQLLDPDMPHADAVLSFQPRMFPRSRNGAHLYEETVFEACSGVRELDGSAALVA